MPDNILQFPTTRITTASRAQQLVKRIRSAHFYPVGSVLVSRDDGSKLTVLKWWFNNEQTVDPWYLLQGTGGDRTLMAESKLAPFAAPMMPEHVA